MSATDGVCVNCYEAAEVDAEEGVCRLCWDKATHTRGPCRDCWDPVDKPGAELCDWCAATPEQRRWMGVGRLLLAALLIGGWIAAARWLA